MKLDRSQFYDFIRRELFTTGMTATQFSFLQPLVLELQNWPNLMHPETAYILATAHHETDAFRVMEEYASGVAYESREDLGNIQKGDGPRYKGRGYPMLTGRRNYTVLGQLLALNLSEVPHLAAKPSISAKIIIKGMVDGIFTGKPLSNYINPYMVDFRGARRVVNRTDKAREIAEIAMIYEKAVLTCRDIEAQEEFASVDTDEPEPAADAEPEPERASGMHSATLGVYGVLATSAWTVISATGLLPETMTTPEVANAATGLIATATMVLANHFRRPY